MDAGRATGEAAPTASLARLLATGYVAVVLAVAVLGVVACGSGQWFVPGLLTLPVGAVLSPVT